MEIKCTVQCIWDQIPGATLGCFQEHPGLNKREQGKRRIRGRGLFAPSRLEFRVLKVRSLAGWGWGFCWWVFRCCRTLAQPPCAGQVLTQWCSVCTRGLRAQTVAHPQGEQLGCTHRALSLSLADTAPSLVLIMCSLCVILSSLAREFLGFGFCLDFFFFFFLSLDLKTEKA